ncbi:DUF6177 family protein [Sinomonas sp. G460-2]|uniref:DUF6177 family protein n=1 Tax=Sinomonas sp. G460-2 TaxID=3393464 RepID=UPI0039F0A904
MTEREDRTALDEETISVKHPLADSEGEGSVRTESRLPIVSLNFGRLDLLRKVAAAGGRTILVTDGLSALTEPMRDLLEEFGGKWVVRGGDGVLRDGRNGRRLERFQDAIHIPPPQSVDEVALAFLQPRPPEAMQLVVSLSIRHRAAEESLLGGGIELFTAALGHETPSGWGTHEPAGKPWDRRELTDFARSRMPEPSRIVVSGTREVPVSAMLTVQRTQRGVEELVTGLIGAGLLADPRIGDRVRLVPEILGTLAARQLPLFGLVLARAGTANLTYPPVLELPPTPLAMLIGAPGVRELGLDTEEMRRRHGAQIAGRPRIPALVFPLDPDHDGRGTDRLAAIVEDIGIDRIRAATGATRSQIEEVERAAQQ